MVHTKKLHRIMGLTLLAVITLSCVILPTPGPTATPAPTETPPPTATPTPSPTTAWQEVADAFARLNNSQDLPDHLMQEDPHKNGSEFDVNEYFGVLDHLSMEPGYVLDYVYTYDGMGGSPLLFARPDDYPAPATQAEYTAALQAGDVDRDYLSHVQIDGTEEGFFQFVVLKEIGGQFYLFWHSNYFDTVIVCDPERIDDIVSRPDTYGNPFTSKQKRDARAIDPAPVVEVGDDAVTVEVVMFSDWGGFARGTYEIKRSFPHTILDTDFEVLVEYDCGIMF